MLHDGCIVKFFHLIVKYRSVEHQIPLIAVGLRETKDLVFKRHFKVYICDRCNLLDKNY